MKYSKFFSLISVLALTIGFAATAVSQESDDAMDEFMNTPSDQAPPAVDDLDVGTSAAPPVEKPGVKHADKAAKKAGGKTVPAEKPMAEKPDAASGGVIDMRGDAATPIVTAPAQPNPALDKIESLMIAEAEMKVFMKAGGLRSRKIK